MKKILSSLTLVLVLFGIVIPFQNTSATEKTKNSNAKVSFEIEVKDETTNEFKLKNVSVKDGKYQIVNIHTDKLELEENTAKKDSLYIKSVQAKGDTAITLKKSTADQVQTFLNNLVFKSVDNKYPENGKINIDLEKDVVYRMVDEKGINHYYQDGGGTLSWAASYNIARSKNLKGLRGYLGTITSSEEEKFSGELMTDNYGFKHPYHIGGTRNLNKDKSRLNDKDKIIVGIGSPTLLKGEWYWANGPEATQTFWKKSDPNIGYSNWYGGEPTENVLFTPMTSAMVTNQFKNRQWAAYPIGLSTAETLIEFSEYNGQNEDNDSGEAEVPNHKNEKAVVEHYVDENGSKIVADEIISGEIGSKYVADQKDLTSKGYVFVKVKEGSAPLTGEITNETKEITFVYNKEDAQKGTVVIEYRDENNSKISTNDEITGKVGSTYSVEPKNITGYQYVKIADGSAPEYGKFTVEEQKIVYIYRPSSLDGGDIVTHYVNQHGQKISADEVVKGNTGDKYLTEKKNLIAEGKDYKFTRMGKNSAPVEGTITDKIQVVTYVYQGLENKKAVEVQYLNENGEELRASKIISGNVGDSYDAGAPVEIEDYEYIRAEGDSKTGIIENKTDTKVVKFIYQEKNTFNEKALIIRYINQQGNALEDEEIRSGNIGATYTTKQKDFTNLGYRFAKMADDSAPASGTVTNKTQIVTYIYQGDKIDQAVQIRYLDQTRRDIAPTKMISGNVGDPYDTGDPLEIDGYKFNKVDETGDTVKGYIGQKTKEVMYIYDKNDK